MPLSGSIPELPHVAKLSLRGGVNRDSVSTAAIRGGAR